MNRQVYRVQGVLFEGGPLFSSRTYNGLAYGGTELAKRRERRRGKLTQSQENKVMNRDWRSLTPRRWPLAAGMALVGPAFSGLYGVGSRLLSPFPLLTTIPAFFVWPLAPLIPTALFFLWCPKLFRGQERVPNRSLILPGILTALTGIYFIDSWNIGMKYPGAALTYGFVAANTIWIILLWFVFIWARNKSSFHTNLLAHFLLFMWLGWQAFPYIGELP